jgi:hypothetical protein
MYQTFCLVFAPWLVFVILAIFASLLLKFAKKRRGIAIAFGVFLQLFLPDPMVEKTIETVIVEKRQKKTQHAGERLDREL